jgi:XTP/dITP diphosphohydrolase
MQIFIASSNLGKIKEIRAILQNKDLHLLSVLDAAKLAQLQIKIPSNFEVEESGQTFHDNALLKAQAYAELTNLATIADDSGLEVEVLGGFPSVNSNRWFVGSDRERNLALLQKIQGQKNRRAKFCTVICFFDPQIHQAEFFEGEVKGSLALEPKGDRCAGFGYDPIFIPEGSTQTFAQLGTDFKNSISHRRQALFKLNQFLVQGKRLARRE